MKKHAGSSFHTRNAAGIASSEMDALVAEALTFLAADPARLDGFFAVTGITIATLRRAAGATDFPAHLLDFIATDERRLFAFADATGREPGAIEAIRAALTPSHHET